MINYIKRNIKLSAKSVFFNIKQYAWFFCAIILIQTFIATMTLASFNNDSVTLKLLKEEYDHHIVYKNVNSDQYLLLENDTSVKFERNKYFSITNVVQHGQNNSFDLRYDVYIRFNFEPKESYKRFTAYFSKNLEILNAEGNWTEYKTPLFNFEESQKENAAYFYTFLGCATLLSAVFLGALYNIRTNYFKFTYGIFMSFGGGFKKIYATSFWEMTVISLTSIIPSSILSFVCTSIIYKLTDVPFKSDLKPYFISLALTTVVSAIALFMPCKRISKKTPISNIIAQDNSNLVSSPSRSFEFWRVSIPLKYELASLFRFRKHNIKLVISGVFFAVLFVWISYFSLLYTETLAVDHPELTVTFDDNTSIDQEEQPTLDKLFGISNGLNGFDNPNVEDTSTQVSDDEESDSNEEGKKDTVVTERVEYSNNDNGNAPALIIKKDEDTQEVSDENFENSDVKDVPDSENLSDESLLPNYYYSDNIDMQIRKIDGISTIHRKLSIVAGDYSSIVLFNINDVCANAPMIEHPDEDMPYLTMNNAYYSPYDERDLDYLERFNYSGDLESVYTNENTIIISDSYLNKTYLKIRPGDKILIGLPIKQKRYIPGHLTGDALLERHLVAFDYEYTEFTVGAVIHDNPSDENLQIYMSVDDYKKYSGEEELKYRSVDIWLDEETSLEDTDRIQGEIATIIKPFSNGGVYVNHSDSDTEIEQSKNKFAIYMFTAIVSLCIAPVLWMFSQRMFYIKRKDEFYILEALGVTSNSIKKILYLDSLILAAIASLLYLIAVPIGIGVIHGTANKFFSNLGGLRYSNGLPVVAYIVGLIVIIACAFISSYFAYRSYSKKEVAKYKINLSAINSEFGE
ncbi:MAG: hypothetical protein IJC50_07605 [Clostridia bacterium]|nr:hypothetical protein [Clostridia bacterium]